LNPLWIKLTAFLKARLHPAARAEGSGRMTRMRGFNLFALLSAIAAALAAQKSPAKNSGCPYQAGAVTAQHQLKTN
jgi:hypothetical protein